MTTRAEIICDDETATLRLAERLAPQLRPGDTVLLEGDVGAGKTHFARGLIQTLLKHAEDVPSPTYTLVQTYDTCAGQVWHADLYRLSDISELDELGLTLAFEDAICLIEWPDRLGPLEPEDALRICLRPMGETSRHVTLSHTSEKWPEKLEGFAHA